MASHITVRISVAWWFRWLYLPMLQFGLMLGLEPREDRVAFWSHKAIRVR